MNIRRYTPIWCVKGYTAGYFAPWYINDKSFLAWVFSYNFTHNVIYTVMAGLPVLNGACPATSWRCCIELGLNHTGQLPVAMLMMYLTMLNLLLCFARELHVSNPYTVFSRMNTLTLIISMTDMPRRSFDTQRSNDYNVLFDPALKRGNIVYLPPLGMQQSLSYHAKD